MSINLRAPELQELKPRIAILGVGGAGGNAVNNMIRAKLEGVEFVVANTDAQALAASKADRKIQIGARLTEGLGAGAKPDIGRAAAEESLEELIEQLGNSHMIFITGGMGGGTGTGAAPVIARAVRELGILTVGVVTKPFHFEGERRMRVAEKGIEELQNYTDALIVIPNQNLFRVANDRTTFAQAFAMADEVLHSGVRGITDLIVRPGLINRDFKDVRTVMSEIGKAMMGTGEAEGDGRALKAAEQAISNPLLDDASMKGARAMLVIVSGGPDLTLFEVDEAVNRVRIEADPDANVLFGSTMMDDMEGRIRVSVVATGIEAEAFAAKTDNVKQLHPRMAQKPLPQSTSTPAQRLREKAEAAAATAHATNPVRVQHDIIERELTAAPAMRDRDTTRLDDEPIVLGGLDSPAITEPMTATRASQQPMREREASRMAPPPARRGVFGGLFGRPKRTMMQEPIVTPPRPRATAQVITRAPAGPQQQYPAVERRAPIAQPQQQRQAQQQQYEQPRQQQQAQQQAQPEDLFGGQNEAPDFEIPAFLRRHANSGQ